MPDEQCNWLDRVVLDGEALSRLSPAMEADRAQAVMDLSGRPYLVYNVDLPKKYKLKDFDPGLAEDFFRSVVNHAGMTLHIDNLRGVNAHHQAETVFKAFGRALRMAVTPDLRMAGTMPSTKGTL